MVKTVCAFGFLLNLIKFIKNSFFLIKAVLVYADDPFRYFECVVVQKGQQLKAG